MRTVMTKLLVPVGPLLLALVVAGCDRGTDARSAGTTVARTAPSTVASTASTVDPAAAGWQVFTSVDGGFRLRYPPGWRVKEATGSGGPVLSLLPPKGAGISVQVSSTAPPEADAASLPNTSCRPVRVAGLEGSRCLDTLSMVVSTALKGRERWYVLATSMRRPARPAGAYDGVLASFRAS